ncbi:MAG: protease inhibitor I42 family protein [Actinomycetota bacterium]|nr:protease inhibitor I42 family protein [Actinomycetota bacterium]
MLAVFISLFLFSVSSCSAATVNIGPEADGRTIELDSGSTLVVNLESNPTTGYNWVISQKSNTPGLTLISNQYQPAETGQELVGSGGVQVLTFKAESSSSNTLFLDYQREWEEEPIESFEVKISID